MKLLGILTFLAAVTSSTGSLRGATRRLTEMALFAQYDWEDGAKDVSGSPVRHDGVIDPPNTAEDGTLSVSLYNEVSNYVDLGLMPELDGAEKALFKFEDVKFTDLQYIVLLGGGEEKWWVGVDYDVLDASTYLVFNVGGWGDDEYHHSFDYQVKVGDGLVDHFDSIEYRFDGTEPTDSRLAMRWNGGDWIEGGWSADDYSGIGDFNPDFFRRFPVSGETLRINDSDRSDWDHMHGSLGTVSLYATPPLLLYKVDRGVCRKNADGTGMGSNGNEYDVYKYENNPDVNYVWCKAKCDAQGSCTGFEFKDEWPKQCEIWKEHIGGHEEKEDHFCLVKMDRAHYYDTESGVCRKRSDGTGMGNNGDEYDLYRYKNREWCMDKCSNDTNCTGIEHRYWPEDNQQCEVWHTEIRSVLYKPYSTCEKKVYY